MTVRSIAPSIYEFTADGDHLLELVTVESLAAFTTSDSGVIVVYTNIFDTTQANPGNWVYTAANRRELWRSGQMNANSIVESAINIGRAYGIEVSMPTGARLVVYSQTE